MKNKKIKRVILNMINSFFTGKSLNTPKTNDSVFLSLVKETCMDGIVHNVINDSDLSQKIKEPIKDRYLLMKNIDEIMKESYEALKSLPFNKFLIKENTFKFTDSYIPGTRYSCDIDFFVELPDIYKTDSLLSFNNFYLRGVDHEVSKEVIHNGYLINKNVSEYNNFREKILSLIAYADSKKALYDPKKDINNFENKIINTIKSLEDVLNIYKKITEKDFYINKNLEDVENEIKEENVGSIENKKKIVAGEKMIIDGAEKSIQSLLSNTILEIHRILNVIQETISETCEIDELKEYADLILDDMSRMINRKIRIQELLKNKHKTLHYDYKNGTFIDIHFELFPNYLPFNVDMNNLETEEISENIKSLKIEDSIIVDACHFVVNLSKYKDPNAFQGFLKYQTDLFYKLKNNDINWEKIINISKETNSSSQVWFYLSIASKYLDMSIPQEIIKKLRKNSSVFQNIILSNINKYKLLFNEPDFFVKLYSNLYLQDGLLKDITDRAHGMYNKLLR